MPSEPLQRSPENSTYTLPCALTIAGSDSGGNAGIQADLRAFHAFGVHGCVALTALTAQNTRAVLSTHTPPGDFLNQQLQAIYADYPVTSIKTGMLGSEENIRVVADFLRAHKPRDLVVDPVLVATSGSALLPDSAVEALKRELLPLATVVTPNLPELSRLTGGEITSPDAWKASGRALAEEVGTAVWLKGGHWAGNEGLDLLLVGEQVVELEAPRVENPLSTHGTGCSLSAALVAALARGNALLEAVLAAKAYVLGAIRSAQRLSESTAVMGVPQQLPVDQIAVRLNP